MTDYVTLLKRRQASTKEAAGLPPALEAHKFSKKDNKGEGKKDEPGHTEHKDEGKHSPYPSGFDKEKKEAALKELDTFTDTVSKLTEKTAAIVREDHNPVVEQLFRNMVSSCVNLKIAGIKHDSFDKPDTLIKSAYEWTVDAANTLEVPLT